MRLALAAAALAVSTAVSGGVALAQDVDLMQFADTNMDGKVTAEEYTAFSEQGWNFFSQNADKVTVASLDDMAKPFFAGIPADASGVITKQAFMATVPARFKAADKDGDGTLSAAELNATMKPPA